MWMFPIPRLLSPLCLPISPRGHYCFYCIYSNINNLTRLNCDFISLGTSLVYLINNGCNYIKKLYRIYLFNEA